MLGVIVAIGVNRIEIPALVFSSFDEGLSWGKMNLGDPNDHGNENYSWDVEPNDPRLAKCFTTTYDCSVWHLELREIPDGTPFVAWDLD